MLFRSDKFRSFSSRNLFRGAAVLTAAGLITRIMGFFFRIFLSHAFGEENVGLYQLIFPVYALCLSVSTFGIQTPQYIVVSADTVYGFSRQKFLPCHSLSNNLLEFFSSSCFFSLLKKPGKSLLSNLPPPALPKARRLPHFFRYRC